MYSSFLSKFAELLDRPEEWKSILGYNDRYQASNLGRVRSNYSGAHKLLKQVAHNSGYNYVDLWDHGKVKHKRVNRVIAQLFCGNTNPDVNIFVNHLDEDKTNNRAENLKWVSPSENTNWGTCIERRVNTRYNKIAQLFKHEDNANGNIK